MEALSEHLTDKDVARLWRDFIEQERGKLHPDYSRENEIVFMFERGHQNGLAEARGK